MSSPVILPEILSWVIFLFILTTLLGWSYSQHISGTHFQKETLRWDFVCKWFIKEVLPRETSETEGKQDRKYEQTKQRCNLGPSFGGQIIRHSLPQLEAREMSFCTPVPFGHWQRSAHGHWNNQPADKSTAVPEGSPPQVQATRYKTIQKLGWGGWPKNRKCKRDPTDICTKYQCPL